MQEVVLFQSDTVMITPSVARFDNVSYQIANIGSVSTTHRRRMNGFAVALLFGAGLAFLVAFANREGAFAEFVVHAVIVGVVLLICAIIMQNIWPMVTYTLRFTTSSGDTQALASRDRNHVQQIKDNIEYAFRLRLDRSTIPVRDV